MSMLVILLPSRERGLSATAEPSAAARTDDRTQWRYVLSRDGQTVEAEGSAPASELPKAERVVLAAADEDVAWLPARLPKVPASRLREALTGALEDQLLEDTALAHLAVWRSGVQDGGTTWVAALHKPWLSRQLQALAEAGVQADALVGLSEPQVSPSGHARTGADGRAMAVVGGPHGVALWPLGWPGWKARLPEGVSWTVEPAAAQALGSQGVAGARLMREGERLLAAAAVGSNLLQFDLAARMKGSRALLAAWAAFKDRRFRAVHAGLLALLFIQLVGLNVSAWQARRDVQQLQGQAEALLRQTFPSVQVVVDPAVQMTRELQGLRRVSGQAGPTDLETWVDLAAALWGDQPEPLTAVRLDAQGISLEAARWPEAALPAIQDHARRHGWSARLDGQTLRLSRSAAGS